MSLVAGAVLLQTACSKKEAESGPEVTVQAAKVEKRSIRQVIRTEAVLYPKNQAAITPKIVAPVKTFYVNRGSRVHEGQLLAVLENRDLAAAETDTKGSYHQAEANYQIETTSALPEEWQKAEYDLKAAKENFDAQQKIYDNRKKLYDEGALPRKDYDQSLVALTQAKSQFDIASMHMTALQAAGKKQQLKSAEGQLTSAKGKYEGAAALLAYSEIRSPIDGVVTDRPLFQGELATANQPLMTVMDTSKLIAKAHIVQDEAVELKVGDAAELSLEGVDESLKGRVMLISPALDPGSTTIEVWVEAIKPGPALKPGMNVAIEAVAKSVKDAVVVPASAVYKNPEAGDYVLLAGSDGKAHLTKVKIGVRSKELAEIQSGLKEGDPVITAGGYALPDGTKIKIEAAPPAEGEAAKDSAGKSAKPDAATEKPAAKDKE